MDPKTFFAETKITPQSGKCFVLMPFDPTLTEVFDTIRDAIQGPELRFTCQRADDVRVGGYIMDSVLRGIAEAEIVIADLTGSNANVFYELGIAHTVKRPEKVILLIQDMASMPFDLSAFRSIEYKQTIAGATRLKADLVGAISEVADLIKLPGDGDNPIYQFKVKERELYKFPVKLFGEDQRLYDFEILGDTVGEDAVKFMLRVTQYVAGQLPTALENMPQGLSKYAVLKVPKIPWQLQVEKLVDRTATFHLKHE
jgi:hypothetical protein